jgi:hypothetical protein
MANLDANVCRQSWKRKSGIFAASRAGRQSRLQVVEEATLRGAEHIGPQHGLLPLDCQEGIAGGAVQRDPAALARLVAADVERSGCEVHVRPAERLELAPAHPRIERDGNQRAEPLREGFKEPTFLLTTEAPVPGVVLLVQLDGRDRVVGESALSS